MGRAAAMCDLIYIYIIRIDFLWADPQEASQCHMQYAEPTCKGRTEY